MCEGAGVAVVQTRGDLADGHLRVAEQLACHFETDAVRQRAERSAARIEVAVERAPVHREVARDGLDRALALEQQVPHHAPHLARKIGGCQRFEFRRLRRQRRVEFRIRAAQRVVEPAAREHERQAVGVEAQRRAEEVAERPHVVADVRNGSWTSVGIPPRAAEIAQHVARDRTHHLIDLAGAFDASFVDGVVQRAERAFHRDGNDRRSVVQAEEAAQRAQRGADVGRRSGERPDEAERSESRVPADAQREVSAAGACRTMTEHAADEFVGNQVVRVVEEARIDADLGEHFARIEAQRRQHARDRLHAADARPSFRCARARACRDVMIGSQHSRSWTVASSEYVTNSQAPPR